MRCVILQPSFVPWRGFFRLIAKADRFVFYDDVQYDKHGWRNRNRVVENAELKWLTIPVLGSTGILLRDAKIDWSDWWVRKMERRLRSVYGATEYGESTIELMCRALAARPDRLVDLTIPLTIEIATMLGLGSSDMFEVSSKMSVEGERTGRLVDICAKVGATEYLSGPSAKSYLNELEFEHVGINVMWEDYGFPAEAATAIAGQKHLDEASSILDFLAASWSDATKYICEPHEIRGVGAP